MKRPVLSLCLGFALTVALPSIPLAGWTVKPSAEVPLRRGMGNDYKITAVLTDGTPVTVMEEQDGWAKVSLENGKQGWILKRYLTDEEPLSQKVERLSAEKQQLQEQLAAARLQLEKLTQANGQTGSELNNCLAQRDRIRSDYDKLRQDTADVVKTKKELTAAQAQIKKDQARISELSIENAALKKNSALMWFLAGSGVLLLGWLIGLVTCRSKKRRNSLL